MKKVLFFFAFIFSIYAVYAQDSDEKSKPLTDKEIVRKVSVLDIEGRIYEDVVVTMKSVSPDHFFTERYRVKVKVIDSNSKIIWKKTLKNSYLYVFSDGQVQVGKPKFDQLVIYKSQYSGCWKGSIREFEGIF